MILGFIKFEDEEPQLKNPVRCGTCYYLIESDSERCQHCGVVRSVATPLGLIEKLKKWLGIESSSEMVVLSIEEPDYFFSGDDIDKILDEKRIKVLDIEDVPNWNLMFYNSKRINRPGRRQRAPLNRQLADKGNAPRQLNDYRGRKLLTG